GRATQPPSPRLTAAKTPPTGTVDPHRALCLEAGGPVGIDHRRRCGLRFGLGRSTADKKKRENTWKALRRRWNVNPDPRIDAPLRTTSHGCNTKVLLNSASEPSARRMVRSIFVRPRYRANGPRPCCRLLPTAVQSCPAGSVNSRS